MSLATTIVHKIPPRFKQALRRNRQIDILLRRSFALVMRVSGRTAIIESGPLAGMRLAISEHTSHTYIRGTYEVEMQRALDRLVRPGDICYDLGASIGYMTLLMARKAKWVYSFEPAPHAAKQIVANIRVNDLSNVEIVRRPVSDSERDVEFALTDNAYGSSIARDNKWPMLKLHSTSLDRFVEDHPIPHFLKIDVEDEEVRVLKGATRLLAEQRPRICCELHSLRSANEVLEILAHKDYFVTKLDGSPFVPPRNVSTGEEPQILAVPR
jgi:FkbM family methyltransferase